MSWSCRRLPTEIRSGLFRLDSGTAVALHPVILHLCLCYLYTGCPRIDFTAYNGTVKPALLARRKRLYLGNVEAEVITATPFRLSQEALQRPGRTSVQPRLFAFWVWVQMDLFRRSAAFQPGNSVRIEGSNPRKKRGLSS